MPFISGLALTLAAFALGFCMARVSLCAVATTQKLVVQRDPSGIAALALAAATAGLALAVTMLSFPGLLPAQYGPGTSALLVAGGVLLGLGALLNGGCYVSSVSYVGTGNYHYLLTLVGLYLAARYPRQLQPVAAGVAVPVAQPLQAALMFAAMTAACVWLGRDVLRRMPVRLRSGWSWPVAAAGCGLLAALIALLLPQWSYSKPIEALARGHAAELRWPLVTSCIAIFLGAATSAWLNGTFRWVRFSLLKAARCLAGGTVMGFGAAHIPGGNDTLLLWAIPALALYGLVAYPVMLATISAAWLLVDVIDRRRVGAQRE
jgi:toxin CptA